MGSMPNSVVVNTETNTVFLSPLAPANPNQLLFLTTDSYSGTEQYKRYVDYSSVGKDYGVDSLTYAMAQSLFSQEPNSFIQSNGSLTIAPFLAGTDNATFQAFSTADLTSTQLTAFQSVSNGAMNVTCDGVIYQLRNLNFTEVLSFNDIVSVILEAGNVDEYMNVKATTGTVGPIVFSTKTPGTDGTIALSPPVPLPLGAVDITGANYLNVAIGQQIDAVNAEGETVEGAIDRLLSLSNPPVFYTVITNLIADKDATLSTAIYIQSSQQGTPRRPLLFVYPVSTRSASVEESSYAIATDIVSLGYTQTRIIMNFEQPFLYCSAYVGCLASADFNTAGSASNAQPGGTKRLVGIVGEVVSEADLETVFIPSGVDLYLNVGGDSAIWRPSGANGGYFDTIYFSNYMNLEFQVQIKNLLRQNNISNSPQGNDFIKVSCEVLMRTAQSCGMLVGGGVPWVIPVPTGIPASLAQVFKNSILTNGYYVYVAPIVGRTASVIAGAVLQGNINVVLINQTFQAT